MPPWSFITGGPPCSSAQGPPGSAVQAASCRSSAVSSWHNEVGGEDTRGRHAGLMAPDVCVAIPAIFVGLSAQETKMVTGTIYVEHIGTAVTKN